MIGPSDFGVTWTSSTHDRQGNYIGPLKPGKGTTCCNITACQEELTPGFRWWNRGRDAWYCQHHAFRINDGNEPFSDGRPLCIREDDMTAEELARAT